MPLPNPTMDFTPFDILTAEEMDQIVENIEALADGTGVNDGSITSTNVNWTTSGGIWWEELGRHTLSTGGDLLQVLSIPARKYLKVYVALVANGADMGLRMQVNGQTGAQYSIRKSDNGGADSTSVSATYIEITAATAYNSIFTEMSILNIATYEKMINASSLMNTGNSSSNAPGIKQELAGKWANTANQITRIDIINPGSGDFAAGSELIVLGHN